MKVDLLVLCIKIRFKNLIRWVVGLDFGIIYLGYVYIKVVGND